MVTLCGYHRVSYLHSTKEVQMSNKWEPWVWYPEIWASESKFWAWLRGSLRKAVWNKSPIKIRYKNSVCGPPPPWYKGKAKSGAFCALSGEWEGKSKLEIDHLRGNVPLSSEEHILGFIQHLIPPPNSLQPVTKEAHRIKSYADRHNLTFDQAKREKTVIEKCKQKVATQKAELLKAGFKEEDISNAEKRRECYRKMLGGENE